MFRQRPKKTANLIGPNSILSTSKTIEQNFIQNCFARLTPPNIIYIISTNPIFRALHLAERNEFRFCRLINTKKHIFFHFWQLAYARKI